MPSFKDHPVSSVTRMLLVGDPGAGKTASLATLANAGYNLRILDFDNGLDILSHYLEADAMDRVHYATLRDNLTNATAFHKALRLLSHWKNDTEDFGKIKDWTEKDVLVIDSMTFMSAAAMHQALAFNGKKLTEQPSMPEWGEARRNVEYVLDYLTGEEVKCNVVCTAHILYTSDDNAGKGLPFTLTKNLSSNVGRYFNTVARLDVKPGKDGKRVIRTTSDFRMDLKSPAPDALASEVEPDLAKLFEVIQASAKSKQGGAK